jgi:transcription regulator MmyB-like protein/helix-turn-helix protein
MSADYYSRIEQRRGPTPSKQTLAAIARALRLPVYERDHLFRLAGHAPPLRIHRSEHVGPGMLRILDRMRDTPAQVMNQLGETLLQNGMATALLGDQTGFTGPARSLAYRWFTDPGSRLIHPEAEHGRAGRLITAQLRVAYERRESEPRVVALVDALLSASPEFAAIWREHPVAGPHCEPKRIWHPRLGVLDLHGESLDDPDRPQRLVVFTAGPGTESHEKLQVLQRPEMSPASRA